MTAIISFAVVFLLIVVGWRYAARRRGLPCPEWLVPLLENPYMNWVAGSERLMERAGIERGMRVLDVGCGPGRLTIPAAELVGASGEVVALDVQEGMLSRLNERIAERRITNIRTLQAGAGQGAVPEDSFDRALLVTVLGEIPERRLALGEVHRALKADGVLSVTEVIPDPHYQRKSKLQAMAHETGFDLDQRWDGLLSYTMNFRKREAT